MQIIININKYEEWLKIEDVEPDYIQPKTHGKKYEQVSPNSLRWLQAAKDCCEV